MLNDWSDRPRDNAGDSRALKWAVLLFAAFIMVALVASAADARGKKGKNRRANTAAISRVVTGTADYYPNCAAVRAAGAAPIRRGQRGYSRKLDRDGDGVACE